MTLTAAEAANQRPALRSRDPCGPIRGQDQQRGREETGEEFDQWASEVTRVTMGGDSIIGVWQKILIQKNDWEIVP